MSGFRIGNQSAFSADPLTRPFDFAVANGFEAFEWFPDRRPDGAGWQCSDLDAHTRLKFRQRARDAGIRLSVHAPVTADPLRPGPELDNALKLAVDLGAGLLNIQLTDSRRVEDFAAAVTPLVQRCSISGVKLAIENTPLTSPQDFNRLFALLPRATRNGPPVGMCLDIGHANLHDATRNDYIGYLERVSPEVPIVHVHLHENYGDQDSHLPLFTGPASRDALGLAALIDRLCRRHFSGCMIMEQWPHPPELLAIARDKLAALIHDCGKHK